MSRINTNLARMKIVDIFLIALSIKLVQSDCTWDWQFDCKNGKCIRPREVCDGYNTCGNCEDEINCDDWRWGRRSCSHGYFGCSRFDKCISPYERCNGRDDCGDCSDERFCRASCEYPPEPQNAYANRNSFQHGERVSYSCDRYYHKTRSEDVECKNGEFVGRLPECKDTRCYVSRLISIAGLKLSSQKFYTSGDSFEPSCIDGYSLVPAKDKRIRCYEGEWEGHLNPCEITPCSSDPPESINAELSAVNKKHGGKALYKCIEYHQKVQKESVICLNGNWQGLPAICKDTRCSLSQIESSGIRNPGSEMFENGQSFVPSCKEGYYLNNTNNITCQDGQWSENVSPCTPAKCESDPPLAENAEIVKIQRDHGGKVTYSCQTNYQKLEEETVFCNFGKWEGKAAKCKDTRCYFSKLNSATFEDPGQEIYENQESFTFSCSEGYMVANAEETSFTCIDGEWIGPLLPCIPAPCEDDPPEVPNARIVSAQNIHRGKVVYTCNQHYRKIVTEKVTCFFGIWIGKKAVCKDTRCYFAKLISEGIKDSGTEIVENGQSFTPSCLEGYTLVQSENKEIHCNDGEWTGHVTPCVPASCEIEPPEIENGRILTIEREHGGIVTYKCNKHFKKSREETIICQFGTWEGSAAICEDTRLYITP